MGQAKKRGSFAQRLAQATARNKALVADIKDSSELQAFLRIEPNALDSMSNTDIQALAMRLVMRGYRPNPRRKTKTK